MDYRILSIEFYRSSLSIIQYWELLSIVGFIFESIGALMSKLYLNLMWKLVLESLVIYSPTLRVLLSLRVLRSNLSIVQFIDSYSPQFYSRILTKAAFENFIINVGLKLFYPISKTCFKFNVESFVTKYLRHFNIDNYKLKFNESCSNEIITIHLWIRNCSPQFYPISDLNLRFNCFRKNFFHNRIYPTKTL